MALAYSLWPAQAYIHIESTLTELMYGFTPSLTSVPVAPQQMLCSPVEVQLLEDELTVQSTACQGQFCPIGAVQGHAEGVSVIDSPQPHRSQVLIAQFQLREFPFLCKTRIYVYRWLFRARLTDASPCLRPWKQKTDESQAGSGQLVIIWISFPLGGPNRFDLPSLTFCLPLCSS